LKQLTEIKSQHENTDTSYSCMMAFFITSAVMVVYLFMSTRTTLWDRDEPRYARVAVEMVDSGHYLVPTFNDQMWFDKPPLLYWLMSLPVRLLGPTELACRFFGVVGTALTCLLTFYIGRRLFDSKSALWAMVILASTLLVLVVGSAATSDAVLLPFIVAVMMIFAYKSVSGTRFYHVILIGIALGLGMLTKGPVGLMPIPVIGAILWFNRKTTGNILRNILLVGTSLTIGFLIFAAWAIPVNSFTNGEFFRVFIGRNVLTRALKPMEHHGGNFLLYLPYYLPVVIVGFFPWTLHLPGALSAVAGGRVGGKYGRIFLFSWIVPIFIIMTLAATKLPHYILFIWPALALAVAGTITAAHQNGLTERDRIWLRRGVWFYGPLAIIIAFGLMIGSWFQQIPGLGWPGLVSGIVLLMMAVPAIYYQRDNRPQASAKVLIVGMLVFEIPVLFGILPAIEQVKLSPAIAKAVKSKTNKDTPVVVYNYREPTLNFYIGRHIESLRSEEEVVAWAKQPDYGVLIIPNDMLNQIQRSYGTLLLDKIASKKGLNYSKGKTLELAALIRRMDK